MKEEYSENYRRWYDKDPILSKSMSTLEKSDDETQIKVAQVSWISGLISFSLFSNKSVFLHPIVEVSAIIWRLILDEETQSKSTTVKFCTPALARDSRANPPTPPRPKTKTVLSLSSFCVSFPQMSSFREKSAMIFRLF